MKRVWIIALGLALLAVAVYWRLNDAAPAPTATALLPQTTVLLLQFPDWTRTRANFRNTAAGALWREPQVQTLAQDLNRAFMESLGAPKGRARHESYLASVLAPADGEVFFALTELSLQPRPGFKAVLGVDVRRNLLATKLALAWREFRIRTWNRAARFYSKKHCGVAYRVWELTPRLRLYHVFLHSLLVYTHDEETLHAILHRFTKQSRDHLPSLIRRPFPEFLLYLNPSLIRNGWPWLTRTEPVLIGATFLDTQIRDIRYASSPRASPAALRFGTMRFTTPQTAVYRVSLTDWETAYREFAETLAASGDSTLLSRFTRFEQTLRQNGIRPAEDLFRWLGPETAVIAHWRAGARLPDVAFIVELQQPAVTRLRLDVAMTALKTAADQTTPWDVARFHDATLRVLRLPTTVLAPTYFTTEHFFVLCSTADFARELVSQTQQPAPGLATCADYQQAMKRLPARATAYAYCDLRAIAGPLLAALQRDKRLEPEVLQRHLGPLVSARCADATITLSPLGEPASLALGAFAAYVALNPAAPTTSSGTPARGNPTAPSQTPSP